jgi:hypothetical protein
VPGNSINASSFFSSIKYDDSSLDLIVMVGRSLDLNVDTIYIDGRSSYGDDELVFEKTL